VLATAAHTQETPSPDAPREQAPAETIAPPDEPATTIATTAPATEGAPTLTLAEAVALALHDNGSIQDTADALTVARVREQSAAAAFWPKLTPRYERATDSQSMLLEGSQRLPWTGGSLSATAGVRSYAPGQSTVPRTSDVRVNLSQPLLRGFGPTASSYDLTNNRRARQGQERSFEMARQRLAVQVAQTFYDVQQQRELVVVSAQSLKRGQALQRASEARLQVGLVSKLDVFRAQLQAAQAEDASIRAQSALQTALERFRVLLGLSPTDPSEPAAAALADVPEEGTEDLAALVARARQHRLDLQETRDSVSDAHRATSIARQSLWPQLDLNVGWNRLGFGSVSVLDGLLHAGDRRFTVFLSTSYPLERSSSRASHQLARIEETARGRDVLQREREIEAEVRAAVRELVRIRQSVALQRKSLVVAEQQQRLATLRYQRGLASNFDVVDAEGSLVLARSALVGLLASYHVATIELRRVTGTLDVVKDFAP
jgi:outer membrane protein